MSASNWQFIRNRAAKCGLSLACVSACLVATAVAAPLGLDPSFGQGGVVITPTPVNTMNGRIFGVAQDAQGRLIAVGETYFERYAVLRYQPDGSLDNSFGQGGFVQTDFGIPSGANGVAIQPDGRIIAAGFGQAGAIGEASLARYNPDGSRDLGFGNNGRVRTNIGREGGGATDLALQRDGRIVVVGVAYKNSNQYAGVVLRYKADGDVDIGFGRRGEVRFEATGPGFSGLRDVAVLPSGKILVAGDFRGKFLLARLRANGRLDHSFGGGDGRVTTEVDRSRRCECAIADSLAVRPGGKVIVQGDVDSPAPRSFVALARYRKDGRLDRSFGNKGITRTKLGEHVTGEDLVLQKDGRILVAGSVGKPPRFTVFSYQPNGRLDLSFGSGGLLEPLGSDSAANAALVQSDGRIVVGGTVGRAEREQFALVRLLQGS